jgi:hypothetical protein
VGVFCAISTMIRVILVSFALGVGAGVSVTAAAGSASAPEIAPPSSVPVPGLDVLVQADRREEVWRGESLHRLPARPVGQPVIE